MPDENRLIEIIKKYKIILIISIFSLIFFFLIFVCFSIYIFFRINNSKVSTEKATTSKDITPTTTTTNTNTPTISISPIVQPDLSNANCNGLKNDYSGNSVIDENFDYIRNLLSICISFLDLPEFSFTSQTSDPLTASDYSDLKILSTIFREEYGKYNKTFIRKINLKQVVFAKNIKISNQSRAAIPDYYNEILYYDIKLSLYDSYTREAFHHELYHNIEQEIFGDGYYFDKSWNAFNKSDFVYGKGGATCQTVVPKRISGFATGYSQCGLEEDKAEVFAYLLTDEFNKVLKNLINSGDLVLKNKVNYMINFLKELGLVVKL